MCGEVVERGPFGGNGVEHGESLHRCGCVEFLRSDGEGGFTETGSQIAWSAPRTGTDGFDAVEVPLAVIYAGVLG